VRTGGNRYFDAQSSTSFASRGARTEPVVVVAIRDVTHTILERERVALSTFTLP
jgi:hypothetical protein